MNVPSVNDIVVPSEYATIKLKFNPHSRDMEETTNALPISTLSHKYQDDSSLQPFQNDSDKCHSDVWFAHFTKLRKMAAKLCSKRPMEFNKKTLHPHSNSSSNSISSSINATNFANLKKQIDSQWYEAATMEEFILKTGCRIGKNSNAATPTHVSMANDKLCIPKEDLHKWFRVLALQYTKTSGTSHFCEIADPTQLRFYADWDFKIRAAKSGQALPSEFILRRVREFISVVRQFFYDIDSPQLCEDTRLKLAQFMPEGLNSVIVSYVDGSGEASKSSAEYAESYTRHGVHLNCPTLIVTMVQAKQIAKALLQHFEQVFNHDPEQDEWCVNTVAEQLDLQPYKNKGGLRSIFQGKMTFCHCTNLGKSATRTCVKCNHTGKIDVGRVYQPIFFVRSVDGQVDECKTRELCQPSGTELAMNAASILVTEGFPHRVDYHVPPNAPVLDVTAEELRQSRVEALPSSQSLDYGAETQTNPTMSTMSTSSLLLDPCFFDPSRINYYELWSTLNQMPSMSSAVPSALLFALAPKIKLPGLNVVDVNTLKAKDQQKSRLTKRYGSLIASDVMENPEFGPLVNTAIKHGNGLHLVTMTPQTKLDLQQTIRNCLPQWNNVLLTKVMASNSTDMFKQFLIIYPQRGPMSSRYCLNKLDYHKSSNVWWKVVSDGRIIQKCSCSNPTKRPATLDVCSNFQKEVGQLSVELKKVLLGDTGDEEFEHLPFVSKSTVAQMRFKAMQTLSASEQEQMSKYMDQKLREYKLRWDQWSKLNKDINHQNHRTPSQFPKFNPKRPRVDQDGDSEDDSNDPNHLAYFPPFDYEEVARAFAFQLHANRLKSPMSSSPMTPGYNSSKSGKFELRQSDIVGKTPSAKKQKLSTIKF